MDPDRFEILTRLPNDARSRRRVPGILCGAALGAFTPRLRHPTVEGKKKKTPKYTTFTRTVRQPVTQTFTNAEAITIPSAGIASPYPSAITVAGFTNGAITDVNLTLHEFNHETPLDVDVLLVAIPIPAQNATVMSDLGGVADAVNLTFTLDDQAVVSLPQLGPLASGIFRPTNFDGTDAFPGATPTGNVALSAFNGANPNGTWQLLVLDDEADGSGRIAGGWSLQITAEADVQIQEQVTIKKRKRKGGKKGKH